MQQDQDLFQNKSIKEPNKKGDRELRSDMFNE